MIILLADVEEGLCRQMHMPGRPGLWLKVLSTNNNPQVKKKFWSVS
jgi:hypothetical protein